MIVAHTIGTFILNFFVARAVALEFVLTSTARLLNCSECFHFRLGLQFGVAKILEVARDGGLCSSG